MNTTLDKQHEPAQIISLSGGCRAEIYRAWAFPDEVVNAWNALAARYGDAGVFLTHTWFSDVWNAFGAGREPFVIVLYEASEPVAVVPFWFDPQAGFRDSLESLTNDHTCYYDVVADPASLAKTGRRISEVLARLDLRAPIKLDYVPSKGPLAELMRARADWRPPTHTIERDWAPAVDLGGTTWEEYEGRLQSKLKSNLRRNRKRAEAEGELSFAVVDGGAEAESVLSEAFEVEASGWKGELGTAIKSAQDTERFYRLAAGTAARRGALRLFVLRLGGRMMAFSLCIMNGDTVFQLKTGYDEARYSKFSPGGLLHWEIVKFLVENGVCRTYNLLGAPARWKSDWLGVPEPFQSASIYPATVRGKLKYAAEYGLKDRMKRSGTVMRVARAIQRRVGR